MVVYNILRKTAGIKFRLYFLLLFVLFKKTKSSLFNYLLNS